MYYLYTDPLKKGFTDEGKFDNEHFRCFYSLISKKVKLTFLARFVKNACLLLTFVIQAGSFFKQDVSSLSGKELAENDDVVFVGELILRCLLIASVNAVDVNDVNLSSTIYS